LSVAGTGTIAGVSGSYQLIYDSAQNITWLDYTLPYDSPGFTSWGNAVSWANNLSVTFNGANLTGWRLPVVNPGQWFHYDDLSEGFNFTNWEMGFLFYTELGDKGYYDTNGNYQPNYGLVNTGPFKNLQPVTYWSGTATDAYHAWTMNFNDGGQSPDGDVYFHYALAVHDGDVGEPTTPIPGAVWLFGSGLVGLIGLKRKYLG